MDKKTDKSFQFRNKTIFSSSKSELLSLLENVIFQTKKTFLVFTPNPEQLVLAERDQRFNQELQSADLLVPDGVGLMWASRILSDHENPVISERIPGRVLVEDLLEIAKRKKQTVLVVGGRDYAANDHFTYNGLEIAWTEGYLDVANPTDGEEVALTELVEKLKPSLVFVAFGAPWQEHWLLSHQSLLSTNGSKIGMAVGGTFDYLLGKVPTPPQVISKVGLEWLFRLVTQPHRWSRQLKLIDFVWLVLEEKWQAS